MKNARQADVTPTPTGPRPRAATRTRLRDRFAEVRRMTDGLCEPLSPEDATVQSMPDASPAKWHLAHTSWFFETFVLEPRLSGYRTPNPQLRVLFNSYYNTVGDQYPRPARGMLTRPGLAEIREYRAHVDAGMRALLERDDDIDPGLAEVIELGLNHEQQHQELLLMDVKHLFSLNPLDPVYRRPDAAPHAAATSEAQPLRWHAFEGGVRQIGHAGQGFAFDNERPRHEVLVQDFRLASRPVANAEYLQFIADGGYRRPELWLADGFSTAQAESWEAPLYWRREEGGWSTVTLAGRRDVRLDEPVCHVSYYEADAYARWAEARLPTEAEWEVAAAGEPVEGNFVESRALHPRPQRPGTGRHAPAQLFGDVWEWTQSPYVAYPGYRPPAGALGEYNGKFMVNQMILRGGSCATPRDHTRATYRNFFYPAQRWHFAGLRLARDPDSAS